jgi:colanic acid/amylovoran biosynthesis glycosyltransferase
MLKVLHALDSYLPTTQNWIRPQVALVPGIDAAVICESLENSEQFPVAGWRIFLQGPRVSKADRFGRLKQKAFTRSGFYKNFAALQARLWRPSLIHAHFGWRGVRSLRLKHALGVPMITSFYGADAWIDATWVEKYSELWRTGDLFFGEGPAMRQRLIDLGCPPEKIRIQRLGVDVANITYTAPDLSKGMKIGIVGRFVEKKGLPDGLTACLHAAQRGVNLRVTIIGDAFSNDTAGQEIKRKLFGLAAEPALAGRVFFTGFVSQTEMLAILKRQNILLCPSKHAANGDAEGGMPFVLTEAMAMGLIGIGSRHCDMQELITDGRTGYLFNEGDINGLTEVLCKMPSMADRAGEIADAARRHIEKNFNLLRQLAILSDIYRDCAERKSWRVTQRN